MSKIIFRRVGPDPANVLPKPGQVRDIVSKYVDNIGKFALQEVRKKGFPTPFLTGALAANIEWRYIPGILTGEFAIELDVIPYAGRQERDHRTKAHFLLRAAQLANSEIEKQFKTLDVFGLLFSRDTASANIAAALSKLKSIDIDVKPDTSIRKAVILKRVFERFQKTIGGIE